MSGCGSTSSMTGLAAPASAVRRTQSQGAGRAASATEAAGLGPELLPRPEPALHHRLISPLTYFRLGSFGDGPLTPRRLGRGRRRPPQARSQLLGHDLHGRSGAAILSGPAPLLERPTITRLPPLRTNPTSSGPPEATRIGQRSKRSVATKSDLLTIC